MKLKLPKSIAFYVFGAFAIIESVIYIIFQIYDFAYNENLIYLKYAGILTCLAFAAVGIYFYGKDGIVVTVALVFTAISDLIILVLAKQFEVGVCFFIITQAVHFVRIYLINGKKPWLSLLARLIVVAAGLALFGGLGLLNSAVVALAIIYFPQVLINAVESGLLIKTDKKYILLFVGLVLFTVCDICVGIYDMNGINGNVNDATLGIIIPEGLKNFVRYAIWTVYLPAQVLIVLSEKKTEYKPFFKKTLGERSGNSKTETSKTE